MYIIEVIIPNDSNPYFALKDPKVCFKVFTHILVVQRISLLKYKSISRNNVFSIDLFDMYNFQLSYQTYQ